MLGENGVAPGWGVWGIIIYQGGVRVGGVGGGIPGVSERGVFVGGGDN